MAFDITNFIIDRALSATMYDPETKEALWRLTQIEDFSISNTAEEKVATDAEGGTVAKFMNAKAATMSGSNSFYDLSLQAAQLGTKKEIASEDSKFTIPVTETFVLKGGEGETVTLAHVPIGTAGAEIGQIYILNSDSSLGAKYILGTEASATEFALSADTKVLTVPTGLAAGTQLIVFYDYESANAVSVVNSATQFPSAGYLVVEVLGCNICNKATKYTAKVIAPSAVLSSNFDLSMTTDGKHPFEIECTQDYCSTEKTLYKVLVDED